MFVVVLLLLFCFCRCCFFDVCLFKNNPRSEQKIQQDPCFILLFALCPWQGFAQRVANNLKTKKIKVCFIPPLFFFLVVFILLYFLFSFSFLVVFFVFFLSHFSSIRFSSLPCPSNLKEAAKAKETMKNKRQEDNISNMKRKNKRNNRGQDEKKKGKQMPEPPPPKKVLDHKVDPAVLWSRVAV